MSSSNTSIYYSAPTPSYCHVYDDLAYKSLVAITLSTFIPVGMSMLLNGNLDLEQAFYELHQMSNIKVSAASVILPMHLMLTGLLLLNDRFANALVSRFIKPDFSEGELV